MNFHFYKIMYNTNYTLPNSVSGLAGSATNRATGGKFASGGNSDTYNVTVGNNISYNPNSVNNVLGVDAWDLNNDGRLSYRESINWWRNGNGVSVVIRDASYLQTQRTYLGDRPEKNKYTAVVLGIDNYMVHGQVVIARNGHIYGPGWYDFEMHGTDKNFHLDDGTLGYRDGFTLLGNFVAGKGKRYKIYYGYK